MQKLASKGVTLKYTEFSQWLGQQRERNDPVGDLARDAFDDRQTYRLRSLAEWLPYLDSVGAGSGDAAALACKKAWAEYEAGLNW